jgi:hypothetical protein
VYYNSGLPDTCNYQLETIQVSFGLHSNTSQNQH